MNEEKGIKRKIKFSDILEHEFEKRDDVSLICDYYSRNRRVQVQVSFSNH